MLFPWDRWRAYAGIDPANPRLRALMAGTVGRGLWQMLWLPPSLPYYQLEGPFAPDPHRPDPPTKRLVFSAWRVVPRVIAAMLHYEAERQMFRLADPVPENTPAWREKHGRPDGVPVLALIYPSSALAAAGDPLTIAAAWSERLALEQVGQGRTGARRP